MKHKTNGAPDAPPERAKVPPADAVGEIRPAAQTGKPDAAAAIKDDRAGTGADTVPAPDSVTHGGALPPENVDRSADISAAKPVQAQKKKWGQASAGYKPDARQAPAAGLPTPFRKLSLRSVYDGLKLSLCAGWYIKGDPTSTDRLRLLVLNYTANIIANLIGGSFFTGLLLLMDADDGFIGTMSMIGVAANMVQMFAPLLLERFSKRKKMLTMMRAVTMVINIIVIGLIPLAPVGQQAKLTLVGICVAIVNFVGAIAAPGINVWHLQSLPPRVRSGFFSIVTMTVGSVVALFNLGGSAMVDLFRAYGNEYGGLLLLRLAAFALYVLDFYLYGKVKEYPYESAGERFSIKDLFTLPFKNKLYLRTIAIVFLWNVTANIPGSYYTVYLLKNLEVSYTYIMIVNMLNVPIVLFVTKIWSRISSGRSPFRVLSIGMSLYLLHYVGLSFVHEGALFMYPLTLIWAFVMAIGINLPFASMPYVNIPHEHQTVFIGFYSTMANFAALIGVSIGKFFISATEDIKLNLFGFEMINKQYIMLLTAGLMVIAVIFAHRIDRTTPCAQN